MNKKTMITITVIIILAIAVVLVSEYFISKYRTGNYQNKTVSDTKPIQSVTTSGSSTDMIPVSKTVFVNIRGFAFNPSSLIINTGDTVIWTNNDPVLHQIAGDGFESGMLNKGSTYTFKFSSQGNYSYNCSIHPSMKGIVIVK